MSISILLTLKIPSYDKTFPVLIKNTNIDGVAISSMLHYSAAPYFIKKFKNKGNTHFLKTLKKEKKKINLIKNLKNFLKKNKINVRI